MSESERTTEHKPSSLENRNLAMLVIKAGLQHIIVDPTPGEIQVLSQASDEVFMERVAYLVKALQDPSAALKPFDGGAAAREEVKRIAWSLSAGGN